MPQYFTSRKALGRDLMDGIFQSVRDPLGVVVTGDTKDYEETMRKMREELPKECFNQVAKEVRYLL